jgi:hypothetical protein
MTFLWRIFPAIYVLPFILATLAYEPVRVIGDGGRWGLLGAGVLVGVIQGIRKGRPGLPFLGFFGISLGLFLMFCMASGFWSFDPNYSFLRAFSLVLLFVCSFQAFWMWVDEYGEDALLGMILWTLASLLAANLVISGTLAFEEIIQARFQGLFDNPNNIGLIVALAIPLSFARALWKRRKIDWLLWAVFLGNGVACGSRTALLSSGVAMLLILGLRSIHRVGLAAALGVALLVGGWSLSKTEFFQEKILRVDTMETMSNRTLFWDLAKDRYIPERPNLGYGFGTDGLIHDYYGIDLTDLKLRGYGVMSSYYGLAVQLGVPATIIAFTLLWSLPIAGLIRHHLDAKMVAYSAVMISGLLVCINESALYSAGNCFAWFFWIVVMLLMHRMLRLKEWKRLMQRKRREKAVLRKRRKMGLVNAGC